MTVLPPRVADSGNCRHFSEDVVCAKARTGRMCRGDSGGFWGMEIDRQRGYRLYEAPVVGLSNWPVSIEVHVRADSKRTRTTYQNY